MRKLFYFCVAALLAASCSFFDTTPEDRTNPSQTPGGGGNGSGVLFVRGEEPRKVEGDLAEFLIRKVREMCS